MGEKTFLYPCSRCGMCCMAKPCIHAMATGVPEHTQPCPYLYFEKEEAFCGLAETFPQLDFGFGKGCCMKGRLIKNGKEQSVAGIPVAMKRAFVEQLRDGRGSIVCNEPERTR